ncbi:ABC transporter permease [Lysobacter hankyongensis]|uniref:ABC transporter permease n=1 Tax=Lysobacter hankyongensis TaxID=1176535 RepID=A0ABP9B1U1_9GAMM
MSTSAFSAFVTVFRKELRDFVRDRRTFLMALLLGPLVYPLLMLGMGKLMEARVSTQLEKPLEIPVVGADYAPNLIAFLATQDIRAKAPPKDLVAAIRNQDEDVALVIAPDFAEDWRASRPAKVEIVADTTRTNADVPIERLRAALNGYSRQVGALRLVARGLNPSLAQSVMVAQRDVATPEAKQGRLMSIILPLILVLFAFMGGANLTMDVTAGERERQSLEPLLATPVSRASLVSGKMAAAGLIGVASVVLTLLSFKLSAALSTSAMASALDVSFPAIGRMLLVLAPMVLIGTALLTFISAGAKSMKEAQSHMVWLMFMPMLPGYALMAYPLKDQDLWQYAVPFLSQNQMLVKATRGETASPEQWAIYLGCAFALAAVLWIAAIWRYRQEKLAISA